MSHREARYRSEEISPLRTLAIRVFCPMTELSEVRGDYCSMRLLSKEAFTSDKLAQITYFYFLLNITILIDYIIKKNYMNNHCVSNLHLRQKSPRTDVFLDKSLL